MSSAAATPHKCQHFNEMRGDDLHIIGAIYSKNRDVPMNGMGMNDSWRHRFDAVMRWAPPSQGRRSR